MSDIAQDLGGVVLAACPFCGNDVNDDEGCFQAGGFLLPTTPHWVVRCGNPSCNAETSAVTPDDAIAAWNTRAHSAEIAGALRDAEAWERRFTEMLIGVINDTQNALGFTDEEKECSSGSLEIVDAINELREYAARYRWIRDRIAGKEHVAELVEYNHDAHPELRDEVDTAIDSAMQQGGGGGE